MSAQDRDSLLAVLLEKYQYVPPVVIAMSFCRLMRVLAQKHPRSGGALLHEMWQDVAPDILKAIEADPVIRPRDVASTVLSAYFIERGDWLAMERQIARAAEAHVGRLPERLVDQFSQLLIASAETALAQRAARKASHE